MKSDKWFVYILKCGDGRFYTGMTCDLDRRLKEHKSGRGGKFTRAFGVVKLLYSEECGSRSDAMKREARIKQMTRDKKRKLIRGKK